MVQQGAGATFSTCANTYTGTTYIDGGTLNVDHAETAGTSGPLGKSSAANPGSIVFGGGTLQYSAANTNDYSGRFSTAANQPYSVDTNGQNVTWATALTSSGGSLTKIGAGTLDLTGAKTYTGGSTISGGTLQFGTASTVPTTGTITIQAGAVLEAAGPRATATAGGWVSSGLISTASAVSWP